ncbi:hypothetical protein HN011_008045 [Eciton burchellii]|nr:hypothetical protein HN011_008045 [Eciton burchellii]
MKTMTSMTAGMVIWVILVLLNSLLIRAKPNDDSDIYSQVDFYREKRERDLMKNEDITNKLSGWVKDTFMHQDGVTNSYSHRACTIGRRYISQTKPRPKGNSQTLKQPRKINLKDFANFTTDAIARMTIDEKDKHVKDVVLSMYSVYDSDYMYALVQDSIANNKSKLYHRPEEGQPCKIPFSMFLL